MAQTTGAISFKDCKIELSTDGSAWTDASGHGNEVTHSGGERATADTPTFSGDTPIVTKGKRASIEVTIKAVYTETGSEPYALAKAAYENATSLYARWSPKGGASGQKQFTTDAGIVTQPVYPVGSAGSADAVPVTIVIKTAKLTETTVA